MTESAEIPEELKLFDKSLGTTGTSVNIQQRAKQNNCSRSETYEGEEMKDKPE